MNLCAYPLTLNNRSLLPACSLTQSCLSNLISQFDWRPGNQYVSSMLLAAANSSDGLTLSARAIDSGSGGLPKLAMTTTTIITSSGSRSSSTTTTTCPPGTLFLSSITLLTHRHRHSSNTSLSALVICSLSTRHLESSLQWTLLCAFTILLFFLLLSFFFLLSTTALYPLISFSHSVFVLQFSHHHRFRSQQATAVGTCLGGSRHTDADSHSSSHNRQHTQGHSTLCTE